MIRIYKYGQVADEDIFARAVPTVNVEAIVSQIIADVVKNGDEALYRYCEKFDRATLTSLQVSQQEIDEAVAAVDPAFITILEKAAVNIRAFHEKQVRNSFIIHEENGVIMGQKIIPVDRAGLYVPGGTAAYPSTVLMDAIPAKIAGCREVVMVTPPNAEGKINPVILAAAKVAGIDKIRSGLRHREHPQGGQDRGSRQRLRGRGQEAGLRQGLHRYDRRSQRDPHCSRQHHRSPSRGGRYAQSGRARQNGQRRAGNRQ